MKVRYKILAAPKGLIMTELKAQVVALKPTATGLIANVRLYPQRRSRKAVKRVVKRSTK